MDNNLGMLEWCIDYYYCTCMARYLHQIGTGKATAKQNQGFVEKFNEVEAAFELFGFSKMVKSILAMLY